MVCVIVTVVVTYKYFHCGVLGATKENVRFLWVETQFVDCTRMLILKHMS